jgi:uncharacterized membrane protein
MLEDIIEPTAALLEFFGIVIMAAGLLIASAAAMRSLILLGGTRSALDSISKITQWDSLEVVFAHYRRNLLRVIVLGLTFLVAGDIVQTATVNKTLTAIGALAAIVVIREFLSFALVMETTGKWPWRDGDLEPAISDAAGEGTEPEPADLRRVESPAASAGTRS